jgi:O-antigen ligase
VQDTAPFVDRIMYTPALALGGYLAGHQFLFSKRNLVRWSCGILFLTTVINLVFSGGRAGMVGFLMLLAVLVFQRFSRRPFVAVASAVLAIAIICGVA